MSEANPNQMTPSQALQTLESILRHPSLQMNLNEHGLGQLAIRALKAVIGGTEPAPPADGPGPAPEDPRAPEAPAG